MKELIHSAKDGPPSPSYVVRLLGQCGDNIGYFHWSRSKAFYAQTACFPEGFSPGMLYRLSWSSSKRAIFADLCDGTQAAYVDWHAHTFVDEKYERRVLRSLLLGKRVEDYNNRCATVVSIAPKSLVLSMPRNPGSYASFLTESGAQIDVIVESFIKHGLGVLLLCTPVHELPRGFTKNSSLECVSKGHPPPIVTEILESFALKRRQIADRKLLNRLYGDVGEYTQHKVNDSLIRLHSKDGRSLLLAADQSEAVQRYVDEVSDCPGLIVEGAPCTGKTLTLAAMARSYCFAHDGLQLILSPDPESLRDIASTLDSLDHGDKRIINIAEFEPGSPFTLFDAALNKKQLAHLKRLSSRLARASGRAARTLRRLLKRAHTAGIVALEPQDIILATVEQAFYWMLRPKNPRRPCPIQKQLQRVSRIIIQDSHDLTEAELNALVLLYARPGTKIVSVGDNGRSVLHQHGCSALVLMKRKRNLPVIKLRYDEGSVWEEEDEELTLDLGKILNDTVDARERAEWAEWKADCNQVFVSVAGSRTVPSGKSYISDEEISALTWIVERLRGAGYDNRQVLILAYAEAQRRLALTRLPTGYEVAMVDDAKNLESKIVIVLTTGEASSTIGDVDCEKRCNIALSAHTEALIVLGSDDHGTTRGWKQLLQKGYFNSVKYSLE